MGLLTPTSPRFLIFFNNSIHIIHLNSFIVKLILMVKFILMVNFVVIDNLFVELDSLIVVQLFKSFESLLIGCKNPLKHST